MQPEKAEQKPVSSPSKKYNYEAMSSYNFDKVDFDFDFGDIDEKKHKEIIKSGEEADQQDK